MAKVSAMSLERRNKTPYVEKPDVESEIQAILSRLNISKDLSLNEPVSKLVKKSNSTNSTVFESANSSRSTTANPETMAFTTETTETKESTTTKPETETPKKCTVWKGVDDDDLYDFYIRNH